MGVVKVHWVDVGPHLVSGQQPTFTLERRLVHENGGSAVTSQSEAPRTGDYYVPRTSLLDPKPEWAVTRKGRYVRVPVHAYRTADRAVAAVFALGMELVWQAWTTVQRERGDTPNEITLVLGHEVHDLQEETPPAFRCYVGMAIRY